MGYFFNPPSFVVDREKPEVDSRDEGKHTERNGLLYVEKVM